MRSNGRSQGFSLLEILVVLVVVGIAVSGASVAINFGGAENEINKSVERFVAYCQHAADTAVFDGEPVGLVLEPPTWSESEDPFDAAWIYRWKKRTDQGWVDLDELKPLKLEPEYELAVTIESELWEAETLEKPDVILPAIVFYPGGDVTFFEIEFSRRDVEDKRAHVLVDEWGRVIWEEQEKLKQELEEDLKLSR